MKKNKLLLVIGQFSFVVGFLGSIINYFYFKNNPIIAIISGLLIGLSLFLNLIYLKNRNKTKNK